MIADPGMEANTTAVVPTITKPPEPSAPPKRPLEIVGGSDIALYALALGVRHVARLDPLPSGVAIRRAIARLERFGRGDVASELKKLVDAARAKTRKRAPHKNAIKAGDVRVYTVGGKEEGAAAVRILTRILGVGRKGQVAVTFGRNEIVIRPKVTVKAA